MGEVYTSAQVAQQIAVSAGTIRTWKARKADQLIEGQHWFQQDNQTLWTEAGVAALKLISATVSANIKPGMDNPETLETGETDSLETLETPTVSDSLLSLKRYAPLVQALAEAIAPRLIGEVDRAVVSEVKQSIARPMTPAECVSVLEDLGIKPANPLALIKGSKIAGLLTEKSEETGD